MTYPFTIKGWASVPVNGSPCLLWLLERTRSMWTFTHVPAGKVIWPRSAASEPDRRIRVVVRSACCSAVHSTGRIGPVAVARPWQGGGGTLDNGRRTLLRIAVLRRRAGRFACWSPNLRHAGGGGGGGAGGAGVACGSGAGACCCGCAAGAGSGAPEFAGSCANAKFAKSAAEPAARRIFFVVIVLGLLLGTGKKANRLPIDKSNPINGKEKVAVAQFWRKWWY